MIMFPCTTEINEKKRDLLFPFYYQYTVFLIFQSDAKRFNFIYTIYEC